MRPLRILLRRRQTPPGPLHANATASPCDAHPSSYHRPLLRRTQWHHPVVRAWQRHYTPPSPPFPGVYSGEQLWDARGIWLGPTCHDVTHFWIVTLMHAIAERRGGAGAGEPQLASVDAAVATFRGSTRRDPLFQRAVLSPQRFVAVGGSLDALIAAGEWGDI